MSEFKCQSGRKWTPVEHTCVVLTAESRCERNTDTRTLAF